MKTIPNYLESIEEELNEIAVLIEENNELLKDVKNALHKQAKKEPKPKE